jgi:hypothetical protein
MSLTARARISVVWLLLVVATLASWGSARGADRRLATGAVLVLAFAKVRFIGLEFMELRSAPPALRLAFEVWLLVVCTALLGLYWRSPAIP